MAEADAIVLAEFEDRPASTVTTVPAAPRPDRPRLRPGNHPPSDSIAVAAADDDRVASPATDSPGPEVLTIDIGLIDPETGSFVTVYSAGTLIAALRPRTVSVPMSHAGPQPTLVLHARAAGEVTPTPFLSLQFPEGHQGPLTLRFARPEDPKSLLVDGGSNRANGAPRFGTSAGDGLNRPE